jgi:hypothetical protein
LAALAALLAPAGVFAQEIVSPTEALPLRESPPGTFFQGMGEQIGTVTPGESYLVLEERAVPTIFGSQHWLKVEPLGERATTGWVFSGSGDAQLFGEAPASAAIRD